MKATDATEAVNQISELLQILLKEHAIEGKISTEVKPSKKLKTLLSNSKKHLRTRALSSKESAHAFITLLSGVNHAKNTDVLAMLKDKSQQDITTQLMDVIGASSNPEAHEAAYQTYVNPNKATTRIDVFERYMLALSQSQHINDDIVEKLFLDAQKVQTKKPGHEKIRQTLVLTLATLCKKSANVELKSKIFISSCY